MDNDTATTAGEVIRLSEQAITYRLRDCHRELTLLMLDFGKCEDRKWAAENIGTIAALRQEVDETIADFECDFGVALDRVTGRRPA